MRTILAQLLAVGPELAAFILSAPILSPHSRAYAASQSTNTVPSPNLNLASLGRVALAGDFDSISLYTYPGQNEDSFNTNGSQSLLTRGPNGAFTSLGLADASIVTMCPFVQKGGTLAGVIVGGNFTSLAGIEAQSIALWNPNTSHVTALPGLSGSVNAVYCDNSSGTVYVGGSFTGGNSTNALAWTTGWTNLPFAGFNGPVTTITKNAAGNIVFGGDFDGLGNSTKPRVPDSQVVNLGSAHLTASGTTTAATSSDPSKIICNTGQSNDWLLEDNTSGYWQANFSFGFNPTKLRLYNTQKNGRGTRQFYFQDLNSGGILNLNYIDANGQNRSCSAPCPLADNSSAQDFHFVPPVGMNAFRIVITAWYGAGGGLSGVEMFQDDIYSFAVNAFNEPMCDDVSNGSSSTFTPSSGVWNRIPSRGQTTSDYLSAELNSTADINAAPSVVFMPDIKQSGNYSITVYTPGCIQDKTCATRGQVNITGAMVSTQPLASTTLYQTNNYDKYDQVYYGYVDVDSGSFKPSVTLTPVARQAAPVTVVAQQVRFELITTTGGLNGLFEYNPNRTTVNTTDFSTSVVDAAGASLDVGAQINVVQSIGNAIYVAGNFSANGISNIMSIGQNVTALSNGGLNGAVTSTYADGTLLYVGGRFSDVAQGTVAGLSNVASYDTSSKKWAPLGAGVNGAVSDLVELTLNITNGDQERCVTINGDFTSVNGFGSNSSFPAAGFAIWVPSRGNWLHNLPQLDIAISGKLTAMTNVPGSSPLYAGQITSQALGLSGAVELVGSGQPSLQSLGAHLTPGTTGRNSSTSMRKRALSSTSNYTGVYNGIFYGQGGLNVTVLAGHFSATASNGSTVQNLVFINDTAATPTVSGVSGLDADSTFAALATYQASLFAGGQVSGNVHGSNVDGLIVYDLVRGAYAATQPAALQNTGGAVIVNAIAPQPNTANVYVGGSFSSAGSLPCPSLCYYDANALQWNAPSPGLTGVINAMVWESDTELVIAGNLTVGGNITQLATYDSKARTYAPYTSASLPGPISVLTPADTKYDQYWAAGTATSNGSSYLAKYGGSTWTGVALGPGTVIRGLQVLDLTSKHGDTALVPDDQVLMVMGNINIPSFGNASAALFNGTAFTPFILTNLQDGSQGSIGGVFVSNPTNFMTHHTFHLRLGLVVLIGLAISLGLVFLIVVAGLLIERHRRRSEGYVPMRHPDQMGNLQRFPPETLLGGLHDKEAATPKL